MKAADCVALAADLHHERKKIIDRAGPKSLSMAALEGFSAGVDAMCRALKREDPDFDLGEFVGIIAGQP